MKMQASIIGNPVHGVGYRVFLLRKALGYGIQKFNASNEVIQGKQQVVVHADGEPEAIEALSLCIRSESPPDAIVSDVSVQDYNGYVISIIDYMHLIQVEQLTKGIPAIISIDKKQDQMLNKQDQMIQKMDHIETSITGEINDLRTDLRSYLDRKLSVMEEDIQQIKTKIGLI